MKRVIIVRSLPGAGKSTLANDLAYQSIMGGYNTVLFSTDDFFMVNGEYKFDGRKITEAHKWNQNRTEAAIKNNINVIIVDNTHTQFWEMIFYINLALDEGYEVQIVEPTTDWKFDVDQLVARNVHGVPREAIERMLKRWDDTDEVLLDVAEQRKDVEINPTTGIIRRI